MFLKQWRVLHDRRYGSHSQDVGCRGWNTKDSRIELAKYLLFPVVYWAYLSNQESIPEPEQQSAMHLSWRQGWNIPLEFLWGYIDQAIYRGFFATRKLVGR